MKKKTRLSRYFRGILAAMVSLFALYATLPIAAEMLTPNAISAPLAPPNLQVAHLAPFAEDLNDTAVNISINGTPVLTDVVYAASTGYLPVGAGQNQIQIFPSGSSTPAISVTVTLMDDMDYTAVAVGGANNWPLELKLLTDDNSAPTSGSAKVRIGHLAPFAEVANDTLADVRLQDGTVILDNVPYGDIASYIELSAGTYDLKITSADGSATLIDPMPATFNDGDILSVLAVGDGGNQPVGAFALPSGAPGGLLPLAAALQIAHLAPFAEDSTLVMGTSVTVRLNGADALTGITFAGSTGYLPAPAGLNQVQIIPTGASDPAISATVTLTHAMDYTAIAVGGANGWPLDLKLLEDDNSAPISGFAKVRIGHLAPFATVVTDTLADVRLQDGTILPGFDNVPYDLVADYIELPAGTYDLKITSADGSTTLIDPLPVTFNAGDILSVFAVGDGGNQPVGVFALPSGAPGALLPLAARLQIAHLAPFAKDTLVLGTSVTVRLNGTDVLTGVTFADSTAYLTVPAGQNQVQIIPTGASDPAISATVTLAQAMDYTAIAVGGANGWPLDLKLLTDDNSAPTSGSAKVRIGHLAPFATVVTDTLADVRLQNGTILTGFNDVPYGVIANYIELPAGAYDLKITSADGSTTLIDPLPATFNDGDILSVLAVGDGVNQPVGVFALPSGAPGGLLDLAAALQIAHLAPFDQDTKAIMSTSVTVRLNGTDVLTDVKFSDSTAYLPVPAGLNQVQIIPTGASDPAISATVTLTHAKDFAAIAVGGANGWPLELKLLEDDNSAPTSGFAKVRIGHLAPFTDVVTATLADVRLQDGTVILNDVPYGVIANYTELPAGTYDLKITSADGNTTLIDPLPVTLNDGDILSVFAVGDGENQALGIFALSDQPGALLPLPGKTFVYLPLVMK